MRKRKRVLIIQPVSRHWNTTAAVVVSLFNKGWDVALCSQVACAEGVSSRLASLSPGKEVTFCGYSYRSLWQLVFKRWDIVLLSFRPLESKNVARGFSGFAGEVLFKLGFILLTILLSRKTRAVFDCHQTGSWLVQRTKSSGLILRELEKWGKSIVEQQIAEIFVYDWPVATFLQDGMMRSGNPHKDRPVTVVPALAGVRPIEVGGSEERGLRIVVPGRIDRRRRNYSWMSEIPEGLRAEIQLDFLGKIRDREDEDILRDVVDLGFKTDPRIDGGFVKQEVFDEVSWKADLFIAPLKLTFQDRSIGEDTISGALWDAVYYQKILFVPGPAKIGLPYERFLMRYETQDQLIDNILDLLRTPEELADVNLRVQDALRSLQKKRQDFESRSLALPV